MPANRLPIITQSAPAAIALVISPEYLMPPSAISGTPVPRGGARAFGDRRDLRHARAADTTRVVQIEPGPIPTLMPSTPSAIRSRAPS